MLRKEEFARGMGQSPNDAAAKDAPIKQGREEYASSMGQSTNDAVVQGAQIKLTKEECA
jgi:hypothetical protein